MRDVKTMKKGNGRKDENGFGMVFKESSSNLHLPDASISFIYNES